MMVDPMVARSMVALAPICYKVFYLHIPDLRNFS